MPRLHVISSILLLLPALSAQGQAPDVPAVCGGRVESLGPLHPWRAVLGPRGAPPQDPPVRCLGIALKKGELLRAVAMMEAEPPSSGVRIQLYGPGSDAPSLTIGLGLLDRIAVTWRAQVSGSHHLVVRDPYAEAPAGVPVRIRVEQVEPAALAAARDAALATDPRVVWLRQNAVALRSIDPSDVDFSDLQPLRTVLEGVRVVMLGEADHAAGSDFLAKSRLVKFLHQQLGFDVLAFEAPMYAMGVAWDHIRAGAPARQAFADGAWGFWSNSQQMQPLIDYVAEQARGPRPIELAGFDSQFSPQGASALFADDLERFLVDRGLSTVLALPGGPNKRVLELLATRRYGSGGEPLPDAATGAAFLRALQETIVRVAALDDDAARFWAQVLQSTACYASFLAPTEQGCGRRPRQMADNVLWMANTRYPGRKIILWSATPHAARMAQVPPAAGIGPSLGRLVADVLGAQMFSIGVTSYRSADDAIVVDQDPLFEFEELMAAAGFDQGFLDLRRARAEASWAGAEFLARPIAHVTASAVWSDLLDGLLFVRDHRRRSPVR